MHAEVNVNAGVVELQLQKDQALAGQIPRFYFHKPAASSVASYLHKACRHVEDTLVLSPESLDGLGKAICRTCEGRDGVPVVNLRDAYLSVADVKQARMNSSYS